MKIAVIPDGAMIVVNMINRYNHEYLSSTNFSPERMHKKDPHDESCFDESLPPFTMTGKNPLNANKYTSNETPSGLRGRMSLYEYILENAQAAIIISKAPSDYNHLYDTLNEMILFGCISCDNQQNLLVYLLKKKQIPILQLKYPVTNNQLEHFIQRTGDFLRNLDKYENKKVLVNDDNLNVDLTQHKDKITLNELEDIINEIN